MTATSDRTTGADAGVEGNSRLTSANGMLLLVLLAVEGITVLDVRGMLTLHIFVGLVLIPPVLLKSATTFYRFARYYRGSEPYLRKGPPHIALRVLGPVVLLSSVALLATGAALLAVRPTNSSSLLMLHKASFIVWFAAMTVHVLGHTGEAARSSWAELRGGGVPRGRWVRLAMVAVVLVAGVGTAAALTPAAHSWTSGHSKFDHHPDH